MSTPGVERNTPGVGSAASPSPPTSAPPLRRHTRAAKLQASHGLAGKIYRCGKPPVPLRTQREIFANAPERNLDEQYVDNCVVTSRYTWYNFVPIFLFQQFTRFANAYFLIVCILQAISVISITNGVPTSAIPLSFVLFFDAIVTAREDYVRHRDDARANARHILVLRNGQFQDLRWRDVVVGDIVKVMGGDEFPADVVFLAAGHQDPDQRGVCHVQTAQLDGETNLKMRNAHNDTVPLFPDDESVANFRGRLICEEPHENFEKFNGVLYMQPGQKKGIALDASQTLLRGCVLKNVEHVYGLVVYTGRETKVRVKQSATITKKASVESEINRYIVALILLQIVLCALGAIGYHYWTFANWERAWYLGFEARSSVSESVGRFFTFFLLISNIIPISLYVSMKLARTAQKIFMDNDAACVYRNEELLAKTNGEEGVFPLRVRSMDLNDELGQISHVFSDKTGTLTSNYMEFRKLTVNGVLYGRGTTEIGMARRRRLGQDVSALEELMRDNASKPREVAHVNYIEGSESHPGRCLRGAASDVTGSGSRADERHALALHYFMLNLTLNHTVVLETVTDKHTGVSKQELSASSPDEEAFVLAGRYFGYDFVAREKDIAVVRVGEDAHLRFRVAVLIPYSSARQMMSVVVEDLQARDEARRFIVMSKGSDTRMFNLNVCETDPHAAPDVTAEQAALIATTKAQLQEMAEDGLRTLCFSYRFLTADEFLPWLDRYETYLGDMAEKRAKDAKLPNKIDATAAELERNFLFQGATANEDKLQERVPETIATLQEAGIKVYMLTGDKQETAINIGYAARMLNNEFVRILVSSEELYSDKMQEDAARRKKEATEAEAARRGVTVDAVTAAEKWAVPAPAATTLDTNARIKLRLYANVARAKRARNQEFARPRGLVVDEPVMNLVWPSIPNLHIAAPHNIRAVYKDVVTLVARAAALCGVWSSTKYVEYVDAAWEDAEGGILAAVRTETLVSDDAEREQVRALLADANCSQLLSDGGTAHLAERMAAILQMMREASDSGGGGGGALSADDAKARIEAAIADFRPALERAYGAARSVMVALSPAMQADLLVIAESCRSVICCRCRPDQKKKMVELIRTHVPSSRCLAVGDGANDVDMIQAAHVGAGIAGPEGVQAANASDYAIGRFHFLARLLLVHGRWNYARMSLLVCYMFYKNVFYAFAQMLYTLVAAYSGQKFYMEAAAQTYNLVFTGLPVLVAAVFDRDCSADTALRFPYLYNDGLSRSRLNLRLLLWWLFTGLYEASLLFVFTLYGTQWRALHGSTPYVFEFGTWAFTALVVIVNVRLAFNVWHHNLLFIAAILLSIGLWFPAAYLFDAMNADNMGGGMRYLFGQGHFWLWLLVCTVGLQAHVWAIAFFRRLFTPEYRDLVAEYEVLATPAGRSPSAYQALCTLCMRRVRHRRTRTPAEYLAAIDAASQPCLRTPIDATPGTGGPPAAPDGSIVSPVRQHSNDFLDSPPARQMRPLLASVQCASALQPYAVDFGPDLDTLDDTPAPAWQCTPRPDARMLYVAEDMEGELALWPVAQVMRSSLRMRYRQLQDEAAAAARANPAAAAAAEEPMVTLRRVKLELLRAYYSAAAESAAAGGGGGGGGGSAPSTPIGAAIIPMSSPSSPPPSTLSQPLSAAAQMAMVGEGGGAGGGAHPTPISATMVTVTSSSMGAAGSEHADAEGRAAPLTAAAAAAARVSAPRQKRRSVTDFSIDERSSAFYSDVLSTTGRSATSHRHLGSAHATADTPAGPVAVACAGGVAVVRRVSGGAATTRPLHAASVLPSHPDAALHIHAPTQ